MKAGDELQKCINKFFDEISLEEATRPEILDQKYTPELLDEIQADYYRRLEIIWDNIPTYYHSSFQAAYEMPPVESAGDPEVLKKAYDAAVKRTLGERLRKDYKDVFMYKTFLKGYAEALLWNMHARFVDAVSKINR